MGYLEKNKISYYSFILSVLVILVHSINMPNIYKIFSFENIFGIEYIGSVAAPGFFIVSGFLFFVNINKNDTIKVVINKMKKRWNTVLLPFLMWNAIYYIIKLIYELLITKKWTFDGNSFFDAVFNYADSPHLWFLYQLILLIVITPIIFYVLKNKISSIIFLIIISILQILNIRVYRINNDALIYFYVGAYLSSLYNKYDISLINKKGVLITLPLAIGSFFIYRFLMSLSFKGMNTAGLGIYFLVLMRLFCALSLFYFIDLFIDYRKKKDYLNYTFFIYCFHYLVARFMLLIIYAVYYKKVMDAGTIPDIYISNIYFVFTGVAVLVASITFAKIMKKIFPKYYNMLTGGR